MLLEMTKVEQNQGIKFYIVDAGFNLVNKSSHFWLMNSPLSHKNENTHEVCTGHINITIPTYT